MNEKRSKRLARATRLAQVEFRTSGLARRVLAVGKAMKSPIFHTAVRARLRVHFAQLDKQTVIDAVRSVLIDDGHDLDGIEITVGANEITGALILKSDVSADAVHAAVEVAERRIQRGTWGN
jgi:hypothetical protein